VKVEGGANAGHALQRNWLLFFRFPGERKKNDLDRYKKKKTKHGWYGSISRVIEKETL
jgi:hypothetical protein